LHGLINTRLSKAAKIGVYMLNKDGFWPNLRKRHDLIAN